MYFTSAKFPSLSSGGETVAQEKETREEGTKFISRKEEGGKGHGRSPAVLYILGRNSHTRFFDSTFPWKFRAFTSPTKNNFNPLYFLTGESLSPPAGVSH